MSKEIYISTTPHETRLAIVEDEQLAEIYYERENEYTLAGSIYNGKVTRVLPGMQSSFVDIGLERDAFLYVTDFMEEAGDSADFETDGGSRRQQAPRAEGGESAGREQSSRDQNGRDRGRGRRGERDRGERREARPAADAAAETESTTSFDEPVAPAPSEGVASIEGAAEGSGSRRWRGRRGRRRGRGAREERPAVEAGAQPANEPEAEEFVVEGGFDETDETSEPRYEAGSIEIDLGSEVAAPEAGDRPSSREDRGRRGGRNRDRKGRGERAPRRDAEPAFDNSYAGYYDETALPEASGEPIVLPGESIRKYRDPAEVAAEEEEARRNAPPVREVLTVSAPSIEIVGWDGGNVLPGETLSRHRNRGPVKPVEVAAPAEVAPVVETAEVAAPVEQPAAEAAVDAVEVANDLDLGAAPGDVIAATEEAAEAKAETEYEPTEGASVSISDSSRRNLRRFEQPAEPVAVPEAPETPEVEESAELASDTPDQTTYDLNETIEAAPVAEAAPVVEVAETVETEVYPEGVEPVESNLTALQASGEMIALPVEAPEKGVTPLAAQDQAEPAAPIQHEEAIQSVSLTEAETTPEPVEAEEVTEEESAQPEIHAFGDGDFHEEELDELDGDDFEYEASSGFDEIEVEEYEEETLEGAADLGSMLHDMTLDRETSDDEDEELEADASGGFTEADFGGEPDEDEDAPAEESNGNGNGEPRRERNDRHRRGGNRDRRGGRNSGGDRGRSGGRKSMQTTDLPAINELLKPGQEILVQIAKEPIAKKGARITSHIALPGRFLVFMPTVNHTGVSRKISSDEERRRLKSILLSEKGDAQGGFIVRTAADGASEEELRNDLRFLIHLWNDIKQRSESSKSPALIYHDLNLVERILRDQVTDNFSAIWVDTEQEYERVLRFLQRFQPSLVRRVKLYTKETPLFEHFGVTQEIDKALKSKVWLKSGGSIVINQTEALVAIDINTGKYVGKTARLEDTILKTNLDAIPEIVRQIRLRDLGGIIVIDFIDMDERKNRAKVLQALEDAMRADRAPSKILPFNDFGLVIMTRKRVKQSLERTLCIPDPITEGTGMIKSPVTIANEIYIEMRKMHRHIEKTDVMLRVHPEVVKTLKASGGKRLQELEEMTRKTILVKSDPSLSPEAFDIH